VRTSAATTYAPRAKSWMDRVKAPVSKAAHDDEPPVGYW
jgi:hypothetical protein